MAVESRMSTLRPLELESRLTFDNKVIALLSKERELISFILEVYNTNTERVVTIQSPCHVKLLHVRTAKYKFT